MERKKKKGKASMNWEGSKALDKMSIVFLVLMRRKMQDFL